MKIILRFSNYVPTDKRTSRYGEANRHFCERAKASHHDAVFVVQAVSLPLNSELQVNVQTRRSKL